MSTTLQAPTVVEPYLTAFRDQEAALCHEARPAMARLRRAAIARFGEIGFPNERNEDWKYTSVAPIVRAGFPIAAEGQAPTMSAPALPAGVRLLRLSEALAVCPELVEPYLGQVADFRHHPFVALNTAFWREGAFLHVPPGVLVDQPIHLDQLAENDGTFTCRRILLVLGKGSQATVVETHSGAAGRYLSTAVTEVVLGDGAGLDHYKVQSESREAYHIACTQVVLGRDGRFSTHYVGQGGALVRNEVRVRFEGENGEATVNGLYLASGTQHADNHTVIDHAQPHCASHELYKGILDGKAKGVFNGKIFVRPGAQKTDAKQTNQTLLLSDDATINTKPQLEIFADDVKCTHGATVGQLDEQQLFYLRSRGVGVEQARALLTFAFANDIVGRIRVPALREQLERALLTSRQLPRLAEIED